MFFFDKKFFQILKKPVVFHWQIETRNALPPPKKGRLIPIRLQYILYDVRFWGIELLQPQVAGNPHTLVRLLVRGKNEDDVIRSIDSLKNALQEQITKGREKIVMLGPASAPFSKIAANYRYHIILKTHNLDVLKGVISESHESMISKNVYLEIDVDPYDLL